MALRYDEIAEILKIIDASSCEELIVETGDVKLVVRRNSAGGAPAPAREGLSPTAAPTPAAAPQASVASPKPAPQTSMASPKVDTAPHQIEVVAPMVGTFYRAPAPDAPPFVDIGSSIRKGAPLCVIEVMKLFTTITCEHDGRVVRIGAENGELVEYGRALFVIEPA